MMTKVRCLKGLSYHDPKVVAEMREGAEKKSIVALVDEEQDDWVLKQGRKGKKNEKEVILSSNHFFQK